MKNLFKNPFLVVAALGLIYGSSVSLVNLVNIATPWYLVIFYTSNLGALMLFMMMVGVVTGACFTLGLINKAKHSKNLYEDDL